MGAFSRCRGASRGNCERTFWAAIAALALLTAAPALVYAAPQSVHPVQKVSAAATDPLAEFFDQSAIQDIRLEMKQDDWETLRATYLANTYYPADMYWKDQVVPIVGIRSHGHGSRNGAKPALRIDFNRYVDQTFLNVKSIVLANAVQDPSMMRQRLSMLMFGRMGVPAPRVVHARLFVNGEYIGLYEAIESVDKKLLARVFTKPDGKPDKEGYLFEYNWADGYTWWYFGPELEIYAGLFSPETHEDAAPADLYGPLEEMFRTLNEAPDADFEQAISEYLDLEAFVRYLAVERFLADIDGFLGFWGPNNFHLYRFEGVNRSALIAWDKDSAIQDRHEDLLTRVADNVLARRVLGIPRYYQQYFETLKACADLSMERSTPESTVGWFEEEMQREITQFLPSAHADMNKPYTTERVDGELEGMPRFARERGPFVANEVRKALAELAEGLIRR